MPIKRDLLQTIHNINPFNNGGIFDNTGGNSYNPPPTPTPLNNILQEDGFRIQAENGNYISME